MSVCTPKVAGDRAAMPATKAVELPKADLKLLEANLGGQIKNVGQIEDFRVKMANMGRVLDSKIDKVRSELRDRIHNKASSWEMRFPSCGCRWPG